MNIRAVARRFLLKYAEELNLATMSVAQAKHILGMTGELSLENLKIKYKEKVFNAHPDKNQDKIKANNDLKRINRAYEILNQLRPEDDERRWRTLVPEYEFEYEDEHQEHEFDKILNTVSRIGISFPDFNFGKYALSIQASKGAYCAPRENLPKLGDYNEFEISIGDDDHLFNPNRNKDFSDMPGINSWHNENIATYVPKDVVFEIYKYMLNKFDPSNKISTSD